MNSIPDLDGITRKCSKCLAIKYLTEFSYEKLGKYKKRTSCRLCDNAYRRKKRAEDPTSSRKAVQRWQDTHKEQKKESKRKWVSENRDKENLRLRNWINKNKDRVASYAENRRAAKHNTMEKISPSEWRNILDLYGHKCLCCGSKSNITMDHIVPLVKMGEHSSSNVQPLCKSCNSKKHDKTIDYR